MLRIRQNFVVRLIRVLKRRSSSGRAARGHLLPALRGEGGSLRRARLSADHPQRALEILDQIVHVLKTDG